MNIGFNYLYTVGNCTSVPQGDGTVIQWGYDGLYRLTSETRCTSNCTPPQPPPSILVPNTAPTFVPGAAPTSQPPPTNGLMDLAPGTAQPAMYVASTPHLQSGTTQTNYTYDLAGNRQSITTNGQSLYYAYNALDQLTCTDPNQTTVQTCTGVQTRYSYNAPGDLTSISTGGNTINYTWDARNRMMGVSLNGQGKATFVYDDSGHRIQSTIGGMVTNYLWDEQSAYGDVVMEASASWASEQANYALGDGELLTQQRNNTTSYYLHDGQGSVRALVNPTNGQVSDTYSYDAYGNATHTGSTTNPYQYTGQQLDQISGVPSLYDLRARYYNPNSGGFLSQDPLQATAGNTGNVNRYWYSSDNPTTLIDPSGWDDGSEYASLSNIFRTVTRVTGQIALNAAEGGVGGALGYLAGLIIWGGFMQAGDIHAGLCADQDIVGTNLAHCYTQKYYNPVDLAGNVMAGAISGGIWSSALNSDAIKLFFAARHASWFAIRLGMTGTTYFLETTISSGIENHWSFPIPQIVGVFLTAIVNGGANMVTATLATGITIPLEGVGSVAGSAGRAFMSSLWNTITEVIGITTQFSTQL